MTCKRILIAATTAVVCSAVSVSGAMSSEPATAVGQGELCELKIEGHSILSLTLLRSKSSVHGSDLMGFTGQRHERPGKSLRLPAGQYRVQSVELEGDYASIEPYGRDDEWFQLTPGKPHQLVIGAPLSSQVTIRRHGKFLQMDYDLVDRAGRSYSFTSQEPWKLPPAPRFSVYRDDQLLGSEAFVYG